MWDSRDPELRHAGVTSTNHLPNPQRDTRWANGSWCPRWSLSSFCIWLWWLSTACCLPVPRSLSSSHVPGARSLLQNVPWVVGNVAPAHTWTSSGLKVLPEMQTTTPNLAIMLLRSLARNSRGYNFHFSFSKFKIKSPRSHEWLNGEPLWTTWRKFEMLLGMLLLLLLLLVSLDESGVQLLHLLAWRTRWRLTTGWEIVWSRDDQN